MTVIEKFDIGAFITTSPGIGDQIQYSALPEIIFNYLGIRLWDVQKKWVYDYNPYVLRGDTYVGACVSWNDFFLQQKFDSGVQYLSRNHKLCEFLGIPFEFVKIRHPRLYRFENETPQYDICIHVGPGNSIGGEVDDKTIKIIEDKYFDKKIIQVGGAKDKKTNFENALGNSCWEMAEIISKSRIFIGIDSGPMNMSYCYPNVQKKIIVNPNEVLQDLNNFVPQRYYHHICENWIDFNVSLYNQSNFDIGATFAVYKI
jgi:hypothetical protein